MNLHILLLPALNFHQIARLMENIYVQGPSCLYKLLSSSSFYSSRITLTKKEAQPLENEHNLKRRNESCSNTAVILQFIEIPLLDSSHISNTSMHAHHYQPPNKWEKKI